MAHRDGGLHWSPDEAGIELKEVPDATAPAGARGLRLAQMRLLTRKFSATNNFFGKELELRLTSQPLYRYEIENENSELLDGALFVYFMDWDPEIFLLIEARRNANGDTAWYYAAARFSDKSLKLKHEDAQVWTAPISPQVNHACGGPDEAFYAVHGVDLHELAPEPNLTGN
jgi:hypothetical protein